MNSLMSILKDERTRALVRTTLHSAGAHAARASKASGRTAWRLFTRAARAFADHLRERRARRTETGPQIVSPFDGEPLTTMVTGRNGAVGGVLVQPFVLTPRRAKCADFLGGVSTVALTALSVGYVSLLNQPAPYAWVIAGLWAWPFIRLIQGAFRRLLRLPVALMFTPTHFSVKCGRGRPVVYDREEPHKFRLRPHEKAKEEAERHEILETRARMRGRVIKERKYYRDTFTLELVYRTYPCAVLDVMGEREAVRILARVKDVDEVMDQIMAMGDAPAKGPQSEWDDMPGKIPERV